MTVLNAVLFQLSWFACVLGPVFDFVLLGPCFVVLSVAVQNYSNSNWRRELKFLAAVGVIGSLIDSLSLYFDVIFFPLGSLMPWPYPLWMTALWVSFGTTLNSSLRWLQQKLLFAALLGGVGGPLAYYSADRFGAIELLRPFSRSYLIISIMWFLMTPLLVELARIQFSKPTSNDPQP